MARRAKNAAKAKAETEAKATAATASPKDEQVNDGPPSAKEGVKERKQATKAMFDEADAKGDPAADDARVGTQVRGY